MLFNTLGFIFAFLPMVFVGFFGLAKYSHRWAAAWMALASLFFYGSWDYRYLPLLLLSITFNFYVGKRIANSCQPLRRYLLAFSVGANLILLGYFKYADFFVASVRSLTGIPYESLGVILPIGISFFTFTQIAFLVDTYQGKVNEYKFVHYLLFVTYFPHLVAGPVLHHKEMMPQFADKSTYRLSYENIATGLSIFILGLAKKVLIADNLAPMANPVFEAGASPAFLEAWVGSIAYALQLYFDFSGYSDMAIGLSRLFGVRLPLNFNSPYQANNITEFWRRWHMTLSRFLRDYLYIPLGGNRNGPVARYLNLIITMLLGGLWHGAGWTFVIWGGLHGFFIASNHYWHHIREKLGWTATQGSFGVFVCRALTLFVVTFAWVFFRAPDLSTALDILAGMSGMNGISLPAWSQAKLSWLATLGINARFEGIRWIDISSIGPPILVTAIFIALAAPNTQEIMVRTQPCLESVIPRTSGLKLSWSPSSYWVLTLTIAFFCCVFSLNRATEFLYFQF